MSRFADFLDVYIEGEQAEEYKRRKAEEASKKKIEDDKERHKANSRELIGSKPIYKSSEDARKENRDKDLSKQFRAKAKQHPDEYGDPDFDKVTGSSKDARVRKHFNSKIDKGESVSKQDYDTAYDASRRHARRHNESTIEFI